MLIQYFIDSINSKFPRNHSEHLIKFLLKNNIVFITLICIYIEVFRNISFYKMFKKKKKMRFDFLILFLYSTFKNLSF